MDTGPTVLKNISGDGRTYLYYILDQNLNSGYVARRCATLRGVCLRGTLRDVARYVARHCAAVFAQRQLLGPIWSGMPTRRPRACPPSVRPLPAFLPRSAVRPPLPSAAQPVRHPSPTARLLAACPRSQPPARRLLIFGPNLNPCPCGPLAIWAICSHTL